MLKKIAVVLMLVCFASVFSACKSDTVTRQNEANESAQEVTADVNAKEIFNTAGQVCNNATVSGVPIADGTYVKGSDTTGFIDDVVERLSYESADMDFTIVVSNGVPSIATVTSKSTGEKIGVFPQ